MKTSMRSRTKSPLISENPESTLFQTSIAFNRLLAGIKIKRRKGRKKEQKRFRNPYERALRIPTMDNIT